MEGLITRISRSNSDTKAKNGVASFNELRERVNKNTVNFTMFVRNVLSEDDIHYDRLMAMSCKKFLFELRIFVQRTERQRNERDKRQAK